MHHYNSKVLQTVSLFSLQWIKAVISSIAILTSKVGSIKNFELMTFSFHRLFLNCMFVNLLICLYCVCHAEQLTYNEYAFLLISEI